MEHLKQTHRLLLTSLLSLLLTLLLPVQVHAGTIELQRLYPSYGTVSLTGAAKADIEYYIDKTNTTTIDQVRADDIPFLPAQPSSGSLNFGFGSPPVWLRMHVHLDATEPPQRWLLEVGYAGLDRVQFWLDDAPHPLTAGDREPFSTRTIPHRNPVFPIELTPGSTHTLYLHIQSEGSFNVPLTLWSTPAFENNNYISYTMMAMYFGAILAITLYNFLLYLLLRSWAYLLYVLMTISMFFAQLAYSGLAAQFLWTDSTWLTHYLVLIGFQAAGLFSALFTREFLQTARKNPKLDKVLYLFAFLFLLGFVLTFLAPYSFSGQFMLVAAIGFSLCAIYASVYCSIKNRDKNAYIYLGSWSVMLAAVALTAAQHEGWVSGYSIIQYSLQIGSAIELILLSFGLASVIQTMKQEKEHAERAVEEEKNRAIAREREQLHETNELLQREVARATAQLRHQAQHDPLTGLANRMLLEDILTRCLARAERYKNHFAVLLIDINDFKPVNDTYGHGVGDALLVAIANRIQQHVRKVDTVARIGGDEFVVVLEDIANPRGAFRVVALLNQELQKPYTVGSFELHVGASIGCAIYPEDGMDGNELLIAADHLMYQTKRQHKGESAR